MLKKFSSDPYKKKKKTMNVAEARHRRHAVITCGMLGGDWKINGLSTWHVGPTECTRVKQLHVSFAHKLSRRLPLGSVANAHLFSAQLI
jgi:hypothetical protein